MAPRPKPVSTPKSTSEAKSAPGSRTKAAPHPVLVDDAGFAACLDALAALDPGFMAGLDALDARPALRRRAPGFEGLAAIIVSQQVSTASANAIFAKVKAGFPTLDAAAIAAASDDDLRACGLSGPKQRALRAIAAAVVDDALDFEALASGEAEAAHATLCAIKGVGPWTADVFLLFCAGNSDAFPAGDLGLQEGAKLALNLPERPDAKALIALAERWRPLRGVAAHCLWAYVAAMRKRPTTLEEVSKLAGETPASTPKAAAKAKPAKPRSAIPELANKPKPTSKPKSAKRKA